MKLIKLNELPDQGVSHNPAIRKRVMLEYGAVPGITNYARAVFPPGETVGSHLHNDMTEIFTVELGSGEIRVNDVAYVFSAGTTVVVNPVMFMKLSTPEKRNSLYFISVCSHPREGTRHSPDSNVRLQ